MELAMKTHDSLEKRVILMEKGHIGLLGMDLSDFLTAEVATRSESVAARQSMEPQQRISIWHIWLFQY
jgi:hypothetical protein